MSDRTILLQYASIAIRGGVVMFVLNICVQMSNVLQNIVDLLHKDSALEETLGSLFQS